MGWLRDLMDQSDSGCRSYGELARAALESSDWPAESRMAERSLASIFSKLDRSQEADWLNIARRPTALAARLAALRPGH